jgi:O-succinylbenzoic acid--CoA ligase
MTIQVMQRDRVTLLSVVPTMLRRLLHCDDPVWKPNPELRAVLVGGAPFPEALRSLSLQRGVPALATYGCTEACSQVTTQRLDQMGTPGCGEPLRGIELRIHHEEIQIRGDVLMDGYLQDEPSGSTWTADGWLRTGDAGALLSDGQLLVRGRMDEIIVTGGENVAPQEVEAWLETVSGIGAACVFSVPHEEWGQQVVAAIAADRSRFDPEDLRARLREEVAPFKHPKKICVLESLPLNRSDKIDRAEVARRCAGKLRPI